MWYECKGEMHEWARLSEVATLYGVEPGGPAPQPASAAATLHDRYASTSVTATPSQYEMK